jgi:hypothetical protein
MDSLEDLAKQVQASRDIIDDVSAVLEDAARSVVIEVINATSCRLRYQSEKHEHGAMEVLPATVMEPFSANVFGSRSSSGAIGTGTQGYVSYLVEGVDAGTEYHVYWENPFAGSNEASVATFGPNQHIFHTLGKFLEATRKCLPDS